MNYKEVKGDLIEMALRGDFDVITHGVNCQSTQGAGIAKLMKQEFFTDRYPMEKNSKGDVNKLGNIDFQYFDLLEGKAYSPLYNKLALKRDGKVFVVNSYTQYNYGRNHFDGDVAPICYEALALCMKKINHMFKGQKIGLPQIGAGLAGGDWNTIKLIIQKELKDCDVTVVIYNK